MKTWFVKLCDFLKGFFTEDNGSSSMTRLGVLIALIAHLYFTYEMIHSLASKPELLIPGNVAGITAYFVGGLAALAVWKVSQKAQEEKVISDKPSA